MNVQCLEHCMVHSKYSIQFFMEWMPCVNIQDGQRYINSQNLSGGLIHSWKQYFDKVFGVNFLVYILSLTAFSLQLQSWVVTTETTWLQSLKYLLCGLWRNNLMTPVCNMRWGQVTWESREGNCILIAYFISNGSPTGGFFTSLAKWKHTRGFQGRYSKKLLH